jgi:hypothetical protein
VFTYCNSIELTDENRWVSRTGQDRYGSCRYEGLKRGKEPRPPKLYPSSRSRQVRCSREARGLGERFGESVRGVSADHERLLCDRPRSSPRDSPQYHVVISTWVVDRSDHLHPFNRFSGQLTYKTSGRPSGARAAPIACCAGNVSHAQSRSKGEHRQGNQLGECAATHFRLAFKLEGPACLSRSPDRSTNQC